MGLTLTDGVLCGVLLLSLIVGVWRGLVQELMSLGGWVAAFFMAQWLADEVALAMPFWREASAQVRYALAFALVFVGSLLTAALLSWLLGKVVATAGLRPVDRVLGGVFGVVRGLLLLLVATVVVHQLGMRQQAWWQQALAAPLLESVLAGAKPALPRPMQAWLP